MARENRRDNRAAAKVPGSEFADLLEEEIYNEEDQPDLFDNADESESEADDNRVTPEAVDNEGEADRGEEEVSAQETEGEPEVGEVAEGEEPTEEEPEVREEEVTEPTPTEPTPTEEPVVERPERSEAPETLTNEQAAELFTNWRSTTEDLLAEHHYRLSDDDVQLYNDDPAKLVSRVASRVYLDSISAAFQQFVTYLPRMVDQVLVQREASTRQEQSFFGAWPDLVNHKDVVTRLGRAYRTQNPTASVEDFINEVGAQAMVALRLNPQKANGSPTPRKVRAFKPASNAPATERIPSRKPMSPWEALTEEFSVDEEEMDDN